jgi:rubrerythrin
MTDTSFSPETASVMDMLKKALAIEKESFDIYAKAAEEAEEDEIKIVYKFLSGEENKHYVIIDNLISYLDNPGRWLYEEENLVFRW